MNKRFCNQILCVVMRDLFRVIFRFDCCYHLVFGTQSYNTLVLTYFLLYTTALLLTEVLLLFIIYLIVDFRGNNFNHNIKRPSVNVASVVQLFEDVVIAAGFFLPFFRYLQRLVTNQVQVSAKAEQSLKTTISRNLFDFCLH